MNNTTRKSKQKFAKRKNKKEQQLDKNKQLINSLLLLKEYINLDKLYTSDIMEKIINQAFDRYKSNKNYSLILELENFFLGTDFHQLFVEKTLIKLNINNIDDKQLVDILKDVKKEKQNSKPPVKVEIKKKKKKKSILASESKRTKALKMPDPDYNSSTDAMAPWRLAPGSYGSGKKR